MPDDSDVVRKLLVELLRVAHVVDTLVKPTREFGRDGLDWDALVGDGG